LLKNKLAISPRGAKEHRKEEPGMEKETISLCYILGYIINVALWGAQCHTEGEKPSNLYTLGTTLVLAIKRGHVNGCDLYLSLNFI